MAKRKKTAWLDGKTKPVRHGVYQRDYGGKEKLRVVFSHWDGKRWGVFGWCAAEAENMKRLESSYQSVPWRGLSAPATQPTKGAK